MEERPSGDDQNPGGDQEQGPGDNQEQRHSGAHPEQSHGDDQEQRHSGAPPEQGPGENQEQRHSGAQPEQASSSWEGPGGRPGNTPARAPLSDYKKWYNSNRPGKKERQAGAKSRGLAPPPGVFKGLGKKGKDLKGKDKGKEKGKQPKGEPGKGKGASGKKGGRTPPPPPPRKRPAAALVEPGDGNNPAEEQQYSYYSTEEEGPQAKAKPKVDPPSAFQAQVRAAAVARRQGQERSRAAAPQGPDGEPSSDSSTSSEDDKPDDPAPKPGEDQDMDVKEDEEATHQANKDQLLSPTEPAQSSRENSSPGDNQETTEDAKLTQPDPNPQEVATQPAQPSSTEVTVEVNVAVPPQNPVIPGANQVEPQPEEKEKQQANRAAEAARAKGDKCPAPSWKNPLTVPAPPANDPPWRKPQACQRRNTQSLTSSRTMVFTIQMRNQVNPCHSRYHPQVKVRYFGYGQAGDTSLDLEVVGLGGSRIVTRTPHLPGVLWKISTHPQHPEIKVCKVLGAVTPGLVKEAGVHQLWESGPGANQEALWVTLIEMEALTPLPAVLTDTLVLQAMFSVALASKVLYIRDVGRGNLGLRSSFTDANPQAGYLPELVFLDVNGWQAYEEGSYPKWPNQAQLSGFWKTLASHNGEMKHRAQVTGGAVPYQSGACHVCTQSVCEKQTPRRRLQGPDPHACGVPGPFGESRRGPRPTPPPRGVPSRPGTRKNLVVETLSVRVFLVARPRQTRPNTGVTSTSPLVETRALVQQ